MSDQPQIIFSNESGNGPIFSVMSSDGLSSASLNIDSNGIISIAGQFAASMSYAVNSNTSSVALTSNTASYVTFTSIANTPTLVSSSAQISYTNISNVPSGVISSSAQVSVNLPVGVVSSSAQAATWTVATSSFVTTAQTASFVQWTAVATKPTGLVSGSIQVLGGSGVYSASAQLPSGLISSSIQLPSGLVSASAQLPSGLISSSIQLPSGLVSASAQISTWTAATASYVVTAQTASYVTSAQTASFVQWSAVATKPAGLVSGSIQVLGGSGVYSASAQLPVGLVSGSAQVASWTVATASYVALAQTASYVTLAQTASYVSGNAIVSAGYSSVSRTTAQILTSANTFTAIAFDTNNLTDATDWTYSNGASTLTCIAGGTYAIDVTAYLQKTGGTAGVAGVRVTKNGTEIPGSFNSYAFASNNVTQALSVAVISTFAPGDVLAVEIISSRANDFRANQVPSVGAPVSRPSAVLRVTLA